MGQLIRPFTKPTVRTSRAGFARRLGGALLRLLGLTLLAITAVPLLLLPFVTATPPWAWTLLAALNLTLVAGAFLFAPPGLSWPIALLGTTLVAALATGASQRFATTPLILGADGRPLPGSIASLEPVELNGSRQWISIRGHDARKPVLLFLAGGPGGSQLAATRKVLGALEEHFVVVNWDQPGAGKSYDAVPRDRLTPALLITDGLTLARALRERFGQEKIYLAGESWGSALAVWMARREPEQFHAVVGMGQMVAFAQTDLDCYETALRIARERGDTAKAAQLEAQGPPPYPDETLMRNEANYLLYLSAVMNSNPAISGPGYDTLGDIAAPEYGLIDKINYVRGIMDTYTRLWPQLWDVDLRQDAPRLDVPIYILEGRHDLNASPYLAEEYARILQAPHKELIWFEHSGHSLWIDESERFVEVLVKHVLPGPQR
ncbi:MAG: alpha/beta fold hydrolase [Chloroflexaceae bacterium]